MYMCVVGLVHDGIICIGFVVSITTSGLQINEHFSRKLNAFQASFIIVTKTYTFRVMIIQIGLACLLIFSLSVLN